MRLGIDLDGVVAAFNEGWMRRHREDFGTDLDPSMVTTWDGLHTIGGFADMDAFWSWASGDRERGSIFRDLDPFPDALETLEGLRADGHDLVIITAKPDWAISDTLRWLAEHEVRASEVHFQEDKHIVQCDVYLDDSPLVLPRLVEHRGDAVVARFVRPWNHPVTGAVDVSSWTHFHQLIAEFPTSGPSAE